MKEKRLLEAYGDVDLKMLEDITLSKGISGHEAGCSRVMKHYMEDVTDSIGYDNLGSIYGLQKGNAKEGEKVLDMGTGTGIIPILMSAKTQAGHLTGLEIQPESADTILRQYLPRGTVPPACPEWPFGGWISAYPQGNAC